MRAAALILLLAALVGACGPNGLKPATDPPSYGRGGRGGESPP